MHRNLVALTALLAAAALSSPTLAWRQGMPPMCPNGTADTGFNNIVAGSAVINVNNGCGPDGTEPSLTNGAPAPSPDTEQYSDLVTGYAQQSLALNLNLAGAVTVPGWTYQTNVIQANPYPFWGGVDNEWNIAGRDYPVGPRPAAYNVCATKGPTGLCDPETLPATLGSPTTVTEPAACTPGRQPGHVRRKPRQPSWLRFHHARWHGSFSQAVHDEPVNPDVQCRRTASSQRPTRQSPSR